MEAIKKKMATLRENLADAEAKADKAEADLKDANERAANVSGFQLLPCFEFVFNISLKILSHKWFSQVYWLVRS